MSRKKKSGFGLVGQKCGTGKSGRRVCISDKPIPGMKCGRNPKTKLYACATPKH